jgi:response regulator of citrate/malate metabolism
MLATVVCGWKARIPKEQIRKDLTLFVQRYNQIWPEIPIHPSEIEKALRAYGRKESTICSKRQLAEWFNTEIKGQKRNGRKREEHLQIARAIRNAKITTSTKLKVKQYLETYKGYSISEISRISGLSRKTIYKYGRELGML